MMIENKIKPVRRILEKNDKNSVYAILEIKF
jgi:hypothetical protein